MTQVSYMAEVQIHVQGYPLSVMSQRLDVGGADQHVVTNGVMVGDQMAIVTLVLRRSQQTPDLEVLDAEETP